MNHFALQRKCTFLSCIFKQKFGMCSINQNKMEYLSNLLSIFENIQTLIKIKIQANTRAKQR